MGIGYGRQGDGGLAILVLEERDLRTLNEEFELLRGEAADWSKGEPIEMERR